MNKNIYRLFLYNQFKILEQLSTSLDEKDNYKHSQQIVEIGSDSDVDALAANLTGTPELVKKNTMGILNMFTVLENAYEKLNIDNSEYEYNSSFHGFDHNNEIEYYCYCKFLIQEEELYPEFSNRELLSHSRKLTHYLNLLQRYNNIQNNRTDNFYHKAMTIEEFYSIVK